MTSKIDVQEPEGKKTETINIQEYEFDKPETDVIDELSNHMQFIGTFLLVLGLLTVLGGLLYWWLDKDLLSCLMGIIYGALTFFAALWTIKAATYFRAIVKDKGTDMRNLKTAFEDVTRVYAIQFWIILFLPIFFFLILLVGLFVELQS